MANLGFNGTIPAEWNKLWLLWWAWSAPTIIITAFHVSFSVWLPVAVVGFLVPELISLIGKRDGLPPLTHAIRHFLPNWVAFPLIYFSVGSVSAQWLDVPQPLRIGALMGLLGWLTDHFTVTYAGSDPFPFKERTTDEPGLPG